MEFYQCVAKCCSSYNHPPKFWPAPISEPPLKSSLDDCTHSGSLHELVWVFTFALLVHCIQVSTCQCLSHACDHVLPMIKVFASYVLVLSLWKHLSHSHTESYKMSHKPHCGRTTINHKGRTCRLTLSMNHVDHVCLNGLSRLIVKSCECVFAWSPMHLSTIHTLSNFCWSSNNQTPH